MKFDAIARWDNRIWGKTYATYEAAYNSLKEIAADNKYKDAGFQFEIYCRGTGKTETLTF